MTTRTKIAATVFGFFAIIGLLLLLLGVELHSTYKSARRLVAQEAERCEDCVYSGTRLSYAQISQPNRMVRLPHWEVTYYSTNPGHRFTRVVTFSEAKRGVPLSFNTHPLILLFNGTGTSSNDVTAFESILKSRQLNYAKANSSQLNEMSESQLASYRLLIVPGGNFIAMGDSLTQATLTNTHHAVQGGLNYLGVCAGAFLAGDGRFQNLNLTSGVQFGFYSESSRGIRKAVVPIACAGMPVLEHYWEDGPHLTGWGSVVGKYPDGTSAVAQGTSGKGWVVLCGVHPEAPENWRQGMLFKTPATENNAYAATLIDAALNRTQLPHY